MGNFVTTGSRISESKERTQLGHSNGSSEDKSKAKDVGPIEDYVMSEASSLLNTKQDSTDNFGFEEEEEIEEEEEEIEEEEENGFHAGDVVWGEGLNSHQWWPGKIYDSSDASDLALEQMQKGKLLVACFGNETFAWCNPSQLKPFLENFKEFSKMSGSRRFLSAVEEAVREIGQHVENLLVCDDALVSPVAVNSGMKEGVLVPDVRREIVTSLVLENPGIVLQDVKRLAKTVSCSDLLEIEVLKRKISAFYRSKGRFDLAKYDEHRYILGLEDKEDEYELDFDNSSCQRSLRKCSGLASKKRKHGDEVHKVDLADLPTIGSTTLVRRRLSDASKIGNADLKQVEEISNGNSFSSRKRKNKRGLEEDDDGIESNDSNQLEESEKKEDTGIELTVDLSTPSASLCKRLRVGVSSSVERSNGSGETIVQTGKRERKKSKYLSPEYITDFSWSARKSKIEYESSQISAAERMAKNSAEKAVDFARLGATAEELLDLIRAAALSTGYSKDYGSSYDMIREFVFVYRSFTYQDGANNKVQKTNISDEKKQQVVGEKEQIRNEPNETVKKKKKREVEKQLSPENHNEKNESATRSRKGVMEIEYLKEKLEKMRALVDQSEGEITEELKRKLEDESRNLLDKISKMIVRSS